MNYRDFGRTGLRASEVVFGGGWVMTLGLVLWLGVMANAYIPTLRLYRLSVVWSVTLPLAALLFILMTVSSAIRTWRGRGGGWKGRHYDTASIGG